jgi:hypothetical protein
MFNLKLKFNVTVILCLLITTGLTIMLPGCYTLRVYHDTDKLREKHDGEISKISMIFGGRQIDGPAQIRSVCPSGASMIEIEQTATDGLAHYMSLGLYSPQTVRVWCKRRIR